MPKPNNPLKKIGRKAVIALFGALLLASGWFLWFWPHRATERLGEKASPLEILELERAYR